MNSELTWGAFFFLWSLLYKYLWTFSFVVEIPVATAITRRTAACDLGEGLPKALVYLVVWHFVLKFVLLLFGENTGLSWEEKLGFFCLYSRKKKKGKKASQKTKSKCVCMYEHNFIISILWGFSEQEAAHCPFTKHTYGDFMVGFVLKIMICLRVAVVYVSVYISFLTPVLFSKVSAVKFLHETIDTFSTRCSEGKKAP